MSKYLKLLTLLFISTLIWPFSLQADTRIMVGVYHNAPLSDYNKDGSGHGFFIDILENIAKKENWVIEYVPGSRLECLERLKNGQIDVLSAVAYSEIGATVYDYTYESAISNWGQLYVNEQAAIESIVDLKNKKVAVLHNDIYFDGLRKLTEQFGVRCRFIEAFTYEDVLKLVELGRCQAGLVSQFFGHRFERDFIIKKSPVVLNPQKLYYATPKEKNKNLLDALDHHLRKLKSNNLSIYYQSMHKWFGDKEQLNLSKWLKWAVFISIVLFVLFLFTALFSRTKIISKTKALVVKNEQLEKAVESRKQAENVIHAGEHKYRSLFQYSSDAIFIHDLEGKILDANQKAIEQFGYTKKELLQQKISNLHPPEALPESEEAFHNIIARKQVDFEVEFVRKNGDIFLAEVSSGLFQIGEDQVIQGIIRDVTEKRRAEEALQQHNAYMTALHETTLGLIKRLNIDDLLKAIVDRAGKLVGTADGYIYIHDPQTDKLILKVGTGRFEQLLGFRMKSGEGLSGKVWQSGKPLKIDGYHRWSGRHHDSRFDEMGASLAIPLKSGNQTIGVIGLSSASPQKQFGDNEIKVLARFAELASIALDNAHLHAKLQQELQERKQTETILKNSRQTFRTVLDSIDATIYASDMDTYEIIFMNKYMRDNFGPDLVGQLCYRVFRNENHPCENCTNPRLLDKQGNPTGAIVWEGKNPLNNKWYINYDRAIKWIDGRYVRLQVATDITKLKMLEKERLKSEAYLRQAQKMQAIGTLAGGIAHDFNNILSAIMGYTELSLMDLTQKTDAKYNLNEIYKASQRAKEVVKQILTFSRHSDQERKPLKVGPIVKESIKMLTASLPSTIQIQHYIDPAAGIIKADATEIHQIIMNLCTNAYHAMSETGGRLDVKVENADLSAEMAGRFEIRAGNYLTITVADTGHGMAPEVLERIFEPYFTTKEKDRGTGMGLAVVHGILKSYGGAVAVASKPAKGTVFTVYIPTGPKEVKSETEVSQILPTGNERILFVDDEPSLVEIGKKSLEHLGYKVETRTSSLEALKLFQKSSDNFDLIITDMTMPEMTGDKLASEAMKIRADIPVVICSGHSDEVMVNRATKIGISAFLMKPLVIQDLANTVRDVLGKTNSSGSSPARN
jgi:PAS domain S-box-containing protein